MKVTFSLSWKNILSMLFASESLLLNVNLDLPILPLGLLSLVLMPHLLPHPLHRPLPLPEYRERHPVGNLLLLLPLYLNLVRTHNSSGVY